MLTLDERTLFYYNLRSSGGALVKKTAAGLIESWAVRVGKQGSTSSNSTCTRVRTATTSATTAPMKSTSVWGTNKSVVAPSRILSIHSNSGSDIEVEIVESSVLDQLEDNENDE
jgi:hypothetical protein